MIEVKNKIGIMEANGEEPEIGEMNYLHIFSHYNRQEWVVLEAPKGQKITLKASDLEAAIKNATNCGRYG